jgi:hypothetical protein
VSEGGAEINSSHIPEYIKRGIGLNPALTSAGGDKPDISGKTRNSLLVFKKQELFRAILGIYASNRQKCGRRFVMRELQGQGLDISEHYLKTILAEMKEKGLIWVGTKRQGTAVSEKGRLFLQKAKY